MEFNEFAKQGMSSKQYVRKTQRAKQY